MAPAAPERTAADIRAEKLAPVAERLWHDPFRDVDWSIPIDDSALHLPKRLLPLYGTSAWGAMSQRSRHEYSRHECAAFLGTVIWFENILMTMVMRHLYRLAPDDPAQRFLLDELGDEARHSAMFGEYLRRADTPAYRPSPRLLVQGRLFSATQPAMTSFLSILAAEELVDAVNRATAKADEVHPVSRQIAQIHVEEEARHLSYAKTFLAEEWPRLHPAYRVALAAQTPMVTFSIVESLVNPAVYRTLGIRNGHWLALTNRRYQRTIADALTRYTSYLTDVGVIDDRSRTIWRALGLVPARPPASPRSHRQEDGRRAR